MREIPLTQGKVALVSDCDFEAVSRFKWCATLNSRPGKAPKWYARRQPYTNGKRKTIYLHQEIVRLRGEEIPEGYHVDHGPDLDGLNCQRENLRVVTAHDNMKHNQFKKRETPCL